MIKENKTQGKRRVTKKNLISGFSVFTDTKFTGLRIFSQGLSGSNLKTKNGEL